MLFYPRSIARSAACFLVADQPGVSLPAVIAFEHDARVIVNRIAVLHRLARALEFGFALRIKAREAGDRRLGDHDPTLIDAEIVHARDHARQSVHQHPAAFFRLDVEYDVPARADDVIGPGVVTHHY